jgi:hypothetical protein
VNPVSRPPTGDQVHELALRLPHAPMLLPRLCFCLPAAVGGVDEGAPLVDGYLAPAGTMPPFLTDTVGACIGNRGTEQDSAGTPGAVERHYRAALALVSRWESGAGVRGEPGDFGLDALCTALAAEELARSTAQVDPRLAFMGGLVCDLGKVAIAHAGTTFFPFLRARCLKSGVTWAQAEREVLGYTHAGVGARLLTAWKFPSQVVEAVEFCRAPAGAPAGARHLAAHLHAAKYVATSLGSGPVADGFLFELDASLLLEHGFTPEVMERLMATVCERAEACLGAGLTRDRLAS